MAEQAPDVTPWELRLGSALGLSALGVGALVGGVLLAAYLLFTRVFAFPLAEPDGGLTESARDSINLAVIVGYTFWALRYGTMGIERDLGRAGVPEAEAPLLLPREAVVRGRWYGVAGLVLAVVLVALLTRLEGEAATMPFTTLGDFSFALLLLLLLFWLLGRTACFTLHGSRYAAGASTDAVAIDLLDVRPLHAFGRIGLRFALLWIVGVTVAAPLLLGPTLQVGPLLVTLSVAGALATVALLLPALGVRRRVRAAKHAELARIADAIAGDASALAGSRIAKRADAASLADLVAYRGLVESVREWPYDTPTLSRFGLYLLIPLASWVAAALVERMVDAALG